MIDTAGFKDIRNYIKRRIAYAKYRIGTTSTRAPVIDVEILTDGTVRVQLDIAFSQKPVTVNRVELYNTEQELWAHQDCNIRIEETQTGFLYWFDFSVKEGGN
jgi:hypothetical protein